MNSPIPLRDTPDGCVLTVRVHPGARANDALIAFLAERLRLPRARIALVTGATSRSKTLRITGKSAAEVEAALHPVISC